MKMLGNLGWRGRTEREEGREGEYGRREEEEAKVKGSTAAFPDDP